MVENFGSDPVLAFRFLMVSMNGENFLTNGGLLLALP